VISINSAGGRSKHCQAPAHTATGLALTLGRSLRDAGDL
jgi:hypothetical protein